jgi:hypothetical protein
MTAIQGVDPDELTYEPATDTYHFHHDWNAVEPLSYTIVRLILALTDEDLDCITPLWESIDPDALDGVFRPNRARTDDDARLTFTHERCRVTVRRNGHVSVRRRR